MAIGALIRMFKKIINSELAYTSDILEEFESPGLQVQVLTLKWRPDYLQVIEMDLTMMKQKMFLAYLWEIMNILLLLLVLMVKKNFALITNSKQVRNMSSQNSDIKVISIKLLQIHISNKFQLNIQTSVHKQIVSTRIVEFFIK